MPIMFNSLLRETGIPLTDVRLVRHKDKRAKRGLTPYELWRDERPKFDLYQSTQSIPNRKKLTAPFWAVFVVNLSDETMFAGLYSAAHRGLLATDMPMPHTDGIEKAGSCDVWDLSLQDQLGDLIGKLFIEWGKGALAWVQYAERNDKLITEVRRAFSEPEFPGFLNFIAPLSKLDNMPKTWIAALESSRGVYLLTCPKTKEQYVGSAVSSAGFLSRLRDYLHTGHGGNVALKSREPSDYQVSILEVAGSSATPDDIHAMEGRWQTKLQSRAMGLNRNLAKKL